MREEQDYIQRNLKIIRDYLMKAFPGFDMTEDTTDPSVCHKFTLTNTTTFEQFKLKVGWTRFSDIDTGPEMMERLLVYSDVAGKLREEKYYYW